MPTIELVHYTNVDLGPLGIISPAYHGKASGNRGLELARPGLCKSYWYRARPGAGPEANIGRRRFKYTARVELDSIRDIGHVINASALEIEQGLSAAGCAGYFNSAHPWLSHVVALFVPVLGIREENPEW